MDRREAHIPAISSRPPARPRRLVAAGLTLFALLILSAGDVQAQSAEFEVDAVSFLSARGEQPRVDVYLRVPYQGLRFVRRAEGFASNYSVTASVHRAGRNDRPTELVMRRTWSRSVEAPSFSATQADTLADYSAHSLELPPGRYVIDFRLEDRSAARVATRERVIEVPSLRGDVAMSDLLLAERYDPATSRVTPNVSGAISSDQASFSLFFEVYAQQAERLRVRYEVRQLGAERRARGLAGLFGRREAEVVTMFEVSDWLSVREGRVPAARTFPTDRFDLGDYEVVVRLERQDGRVVAQRSRAFTIRWMGLFEQLRDLDVAIAQLRYIAKDREIRQMREASSYQERLRLFQDFWDRRDPSPGTRRNERMEEYYFRVAHAAQRYGRLDGAGWETDRGEVYIRFGEPDRVENRASGDGNRPYEVWYYNRIGLQFIFVDESGSGDFRLLVPIGDTRTRMR